MYLFDGILVVYYVLYNCMYWDNLVFMVFMLFRYFNIFILVFNVNLIKIRLFLNIFDNIDFLYKFCIVFYNEFEL